MPDQISNPPLQTVPTEKAGWPKPWGNFYTQIWQAINYGWQWNTITTTQNYSAQLTDAVILIDGDVTVTLPSVRDVGTKRLTVKVINAGGGTRTVDGNDGNIDGAATVTTTQQYQAWDFVCNGSEYFIL